MLSDAKVVALVVGARPQFIKAAALLARPLTGATWMLVHTGQHYDYELSTSFFEELGIPAPAYNLGVGPMAPSRQMAEMAARLREVFAARRVAAVVVVGDTNSTLAGALAAYLAHVPTIHVEAGMRSYDWEMAEERNRVLTDRLARLRLCTHDAAAANLRREGLADGIAVTGDVMYEVAAAAYAALDAARYVEPAGLKAQGYAYVSCHRAENVDDASRLARLAAMLSGFPCPVYFPVHPRTARNIARFGLEEAFARPGVTLARPASYVANLSLIRHAAAVVTDSGGVTREAYLFDVPTLTLRDRTEWPETVNAGVNVLVDMDVMRGRGAAAAALARTARHPRFELVGEPPPSVKIAAAVSEFVAAGGFRKGGET